MKLYFSKGACSLSVRITINEIGLACDYEAVDLKTKQTANGEDFNLINPKGTVPALKLDNNSLLTENPAIQQYLADTHQVTTLLPPVDSMQRYHVLEWFNFVGTDLHKRIAPFFNGAMPQEVKDNFFRPGVIRALNFTENHLTKHQYLVGDQFTLADSYLFVVTRWLPSLNFDIAPYPHLTRYFENLKKRPAIAKSLQEEGLK